MNKKIKKVIVNSLSISRILGALSLPLVASVFSVPGIVALFTFLFTTDFIDGQLARKWDVCTVGGSLLDPLGDKILAFSCIISMLGTQSFLLTPLMFEIAIGSLNIERSLHGEVVRSTKFGKVKTWFLSVTLLLAAINVLKPDLIASIAPSLSKLVVTDELVKDVTIATTVAEAAALSSYISDSYRQMNERTKKIQELKDLRSILVRLFDEEQYQNDVNEPLINIIKK